MFMCSRKRLWPASCLDQGLGLVVENNLYLIVPYYLPFQVFPLLSQVGGPSDRFLRVAG